MVNREQHSDRRRFLAALLRAVGATWPILSALIVLELGLGAAVGMIEGWGLGAGLYFGSVTGLTIGYGDLVPTRTLTRVLAVGIGICGIVLTGLIAALAVRALQLIAAEKLGTDDR